MELIFAVFLLQGVVVGLFCSYVAKTKGRSGFNWFLLGLFFSGLALLALIAVPKLEPEEISASGPQRPVSTVTAMRAGESYQGAMDISLLAYQLFLTKQFSIERNATLGVFSIRDEAFATLSDALREADSRYRQQMAQREADVAKARASAAERNRTAAVAEANRAAMNRRRAAQLRKGMTITVPVVAVLAGGIWLLRPQFETYLAQAKKLRIAEAKVKRCTELPERESTRCLKRLKAEEACSRVGGVDSIKCLSDYMSR